MADSEENKKEKTPVILLIEDDMLLADMYTMKLGLEGFKVLTALNGENGIRIALEEDVDLILLDMLLPRIQGIEVLETLRKSDKGKDIPVIALTNLAREDLRQKAFELGAKDFLVKAQEKPEDVIEAIKKVLQR